MNYTNHSDIKIFGKNGKLKRIIPIAKAMKASDDRFNAEKTGFGKSNKKANEVRKKIDKLTKSGFLSNE